MRTTTFCLLLESPDARTDGAHERRGGSPRGSQRRAARGAPAPKPLHALEVAAEISFLALAPDGEPTLSSDPGPVLIEELLLADRPHLLLAVLDPRHAELRLNGAPAPRAALLAVGDELVLGDGPALFVSRVRPGGRFPAGAEEAGRPCPVCRTPVGPGQLVVRCECGAALHAEGDEVPADARLECTHLAGGTCPACGGEVHLEGGLVYVPAGMASPPMATGVAS